MVLAANRILNPLAHLDEKCQLYDMQIPGVSSLRRCVFSHGSYLSAIKFKWLHSPNGTLDPNIMNILTAAAGLGNSTIKSSTERVSFISQSKSAKLADVAVL